MHPTFKRKNLKRRIIEIINNDRRLSGRKTEANLEKKAGKICQGGVAKIYHLHTKTVSCIFSDLREGEQSSSTGGDR